MSRNKPIRATCNEGCQKEFKINKIRTVKVKGGNEKNYFRCAHCKHEYVTFYASKDTLKLQKDMRKLHVKMRTTVGTPEGMELVQQIAHLKGKIKLSMDEARRVSE